MKKLFLMGCFTATVLMSSCTTDSIDDQTTNTINADNISSTPNSQWDNGDDAKDKGKGSN
jgi:hypothetical protein